MCPWLWLSPYPFKRKDGIKQAHASQRRGSQLSDKVNDQAVQWGAGGRADIFLTL